MATQLVDDGGESKAVHTPFWLFYTSDWAGGIIGFTFEQRGFYFECLRRMWDRKDGLVDDVKWLSAALTGDPRTIRRLRSFLINQGKLRSINGLLINPRVMKDIAAWKRKAKAKLEASSGEDQPKLDLNFSENAAKSTVVPFPRGGISESSSDPEGEKKGESLFGRAIDDDDRRRASPAISLNIRTALANQVGQEQAADLVAEYLGSDYAANARVPNRAFVGWLKKTYGIAISARGESASIGDVMAMCGVDAFGRPDITLPKVVRGGRS